MRILNLIPTLRHAETPTASEYHRFVSKHHFPWRSMVRSAIAHSRAAERQRHRRERAQLRELRARAKQAEIDHAEDVVELFNAHVAALTSVHRECSSAIDWNDVLRAPADVKTREVEQQIASYRPGWFARTFGGEKKHRALLAAELAQAKERDAAVEAGRGLAQAILAGDAAAYDAALSEGDAFDELTELGVGVAMQYIPNRPDACIAELAVEEQTVVPAEEHRVTKTGKLSTKAMPKARRAEIYTDFVCGSALRVAREVFAWLPVQLVIATVNTRLLDSKTGHVAVAPILSLIAPRATIASLNFEAVDASDSMANFVHRMAFKRGGVPTRVEPLSLDDIATASQVVQS